VGREGKGKGTTSPLEKSWIRLLVLRTITCIAPRQHRGIKRRLVITLDRRSTGIQLKICFVYFVEVQTSFMS